MFENSVLLYAKYFVSGFLCQLLISKLEKKNLSAAEKDMIVKVQYKLIIYALTKQGSYRSWKTLKVMEFK